MTDDINIYKRCECKDCGKQFKIVGSTPLVKISCPHCGSANWQYEKYTNSLNNHNK
jgi:hypothetical protein